MEIQQIIEYIIYLHAALGGIALLSGTVAIVTKKGGILHKKSGKLFYYCMLYSALISFVVAVLPEHESPFLFSIGVFSCYFLIMGYRSLDYKFKNHNYTWDKILSIISIITGVVMITYPILFLQKIDFVLLVFGIVGIAFGSRDLVLYRDQKKLRKVWLHLHVGKIMGGYIASVTAFFVVNQFLPYYLSWFLPGILGSIYISYWIKKLNKK